MDHRAGAGHAGVECDIAMRLYVSNPPYVYSYFRNRRSNGLVVKSGRVDDENQLPYRRLGYSPNGA